MNHSQHLSTAVNSVLRLPAALLTGLVWLSCSESVAQEHKYHFHYRPLDSDTTIQYLYDWYEVEPDGWMRRDAGMFGEQLHDLFGTIEPERHPDGTVIHLRARTLDGVLVDERNLVCRDSTYLLFGPQESDFLFDAIHEKDPDASAYSTGRMFVVKDETAVVEFFNLTDGKVSYEHGWFYWDFEEEAFHAGEGASGRTADAVIRIPVTPKMGTVQMHYFEFVTAEKDTVFFNANVAGDPEMGSHLQFQERDRGHIVLGRVKGADFPR